MTVSPFDSALYGPKYADRDVARLFSDSAEIRAMLIVQGALARAQGAAGLIPEISAQAIHRAALEVQIDPSGLAEGTAANGIPVPDLVAAFRAALQAPEHADWIHHGATSQDVIDTALALRLRQALGLIEARLDAVLTALADLADAHAETPIAARTYGQVATPTSFGAMVAIWGHGLLACRDALDAVRARVQVVTLGGAAGTLSVMGDHGPAVRAHMAEALGLGLAEAPPHAERSAIRGLAAWLKATLLACDKIAVDLLLLTRDGTVRLGGGGSSSTMPQKANPVGPATIHGLVIHGAALATAFDAPHWDQRDGGAWFAEGLALPQMVVGTARALTLLAEAEIGVDPAAMRAGVDDPTGLIHAEAISFALGPPRAEAQARVKAWAAEIRTDDGSLIEKAGLDPADYAPERQWGEAPAQARAFAAAVRSR